MKAVLCAVSLLFATSALADTSYIACTLTQGSDTTTQGQRLLLSPEPGQLAGMNLLLPNAAASITVDLLGSRRITANIDVQAYVSDGTGEAPFEYRGFGGIAPFPTADLLPEIRRNATAVATDDDGVELAKTQCSIYTLPEM